MPNDVETRYFFQQDYLRITTKGKQFRIRGSANPVAETKTTFGDWYDYNPVLQLVKPLRRPTVKKEERPEPQRELAIGGTRTRSRNNERFYKKLAFERFRASLPKGLPQHVEKFQSHQWGMIQMANFLGAEGVDLIQGSPILAYMLGNTAEFRRLMASEEKRASTRRLVRLKQRQILVKMHFPDAASIPKTLRKIHPSSVNPTLLNRLRVVMRENEGKPLKLLSHAPHINASVLDLVTTPALTQIITPRVIEEVAALPRDNYFPFAAKQFEDILLLHQELYPDQNVPVFRNLKQAKDYCDEMEAIHQAQREAALPKHTFPDPPIQGTSSIEPIQTVQALFEESAKQKHCVKIYAQDISQGELYVYRVLKPERATLSICPTSSGLWKIRELKCACNRKVSEVTLRKVCNWLEDSQVG